MEDRMRLEEENAKLREDVLSQNSPAKTTGDKLDKILSRLRQDLAEEKAKSNTLEEELDKATEDNNALVSQLQQVEEDYLQFEFMLNYCLKNEVENREHIDSLIEKMKELNKNYKDLSCNYENTKKVLRSALKKLRASFNKLKFAKARNSNQFENDSEKLREAQEINEYYEGRINQLETEIKQLQSSNNQEKMNKFLNKVKAELKTLKQSLQLIKSRFNGYKDEIVSDMSAIKKTHERAKALSENSLDDQRARQLEMSGSLEENKEGSITEMMPRIKDMLIKLQTKNNVLRAKCESLAAENEELKAKLSRSDGLVAQGAGESDKEVVELKSRISEKEKEIIGLQNKISSLTGAKEQVRGELESRLAEIQELRRQLEDRPVPLPLM
eukprot:TRINITY_DN4423_c0_g2_i2.p1 TRINITY_DN4423_c0_g2~~TRINITY_DN4423_c0_g2_i2.p1  ORF type:complete len:385 (+),score=120.28 TRINITY_DN4423_c0_g2_i2:102-1256(+)